LYLDEAGNLLELRAPSGNRLEALKGDRKGQYSIRINDQLANLLSLARAGCVPMSRLSITTKMKVMNKKGQSLPPVHPGEILLEDFMKPIKLSSTSGSGYREVPPANQPDCPGTSGRHGRHSIAPGAVFRDLGGIVGWGCKPATIWKLSRTAWGIVWMTR